MTYDGVAAMTPEQMMHAIGSKEPRPGREQQFAVYEQIAEDLRLSPAGLIGREAQLSQLTGDPEFFVRRIVRLLVEEKWQGFTAFER